MLVSIFAWVVPRSSIRLVAFMSDTGMNVFTRLDKWLWAARFFKTRRLAKEAIEGGKVHCSGVRVKVAKEISIGDHLSVRQGQDMKELLVIALNDQRRGAPEAERLYEETAASKVARAKRAAERRAGVSGFVPGDHRPSKKERRQLQRFIDLNQFSDE